MHSFVELGDLHDPATLGSDPAVIDCRDWERPALLSHAALDAAIDACARGLAARGLARGDRVAILSLNRAELLIAYFAIMRAGLVAVPANFKFPRETIAFLLKDSSARLIFCDAQCRGLVPAGIPVVDFDSEAADGFASFLDPGPFEAVRLNPAKPRWSSTRRARRAGPRACRCLTRGSCGRCAARRPRARSASGPRGGAALPHERARHHQVCRRRACQRGAAAAVRRPALRRGDRPLQGHTDHFGADNAGAGAS